MVGLQVHHSPLHLEGSGDVEVPRVIFDNNPGTTSMKSPLFSSSVFLTSSSNTTNISITSILPRRSPRLTPKSQTMPSPYYTDTPTTINSSYNKKSNNNPLTNNSGISLIDHESNNIGISSLDHMSEKASIEDDYPNFNDKFNSYLLSGSED